MAVTFNIQFRISVATKVIRLTDTSTGFTYGKGCFKVEFPNGVVRNLPDFSTPDLVLGGPVFVDIPCQLDAIGNVIIGSYTISYAVIDNLSTGQTPLVRTFDFNWVEPSNGITNFSDVIIPEVVFKDLTSYSPIGSFAGALIRTITGSFPSTSEASANSPITSTSTNTITVVSGANYYEGVYTPTSNVSVAYTHSSNAWLTILYTKTFSKTFAIKKCPNQLELVQKINAYRVIIDAYKETNDTQFNILSEQYDLVIALYSHLIARYSTNTQDGSETILIELLSILEPYSGTYTYQSTKMLPFELTSSGTNSFNISDGTNVDAVQLGSTLTFASGNASLVPIVTNNVVTYSPTFGTLINTFAQGNDARFHNPVTIGTANGLSISTQALSLAAATTGSAGSMSSADKTKLDGIASGATANTGTVTNVALTAPAAFTVTGSPITTAGTLAITAGGTSAEYITGAGALVTLNTANVPENTNLYFTTSRARTSISLTTTGTTGAATYDSGTGILNIPNYIGGVTSFNTRTGAIVLSGTDVTTALSFTPYNATNPAGYISSITSGNVTSALGYTPENAANKGIANGYASLDGGGLVPSTQLPSYVDDVLEYTNLAGFPATGVAGKIYVDLYTNKIYRWSGSTYIEVSPTVGTVTSVAALTLGTTGLDVSSSVATGTTTPVITLNIPTASITNRGVLSSIDWNKFNFKPDFVTGKNLFNKDSSNIINGQYLGSIGDLNLNASYFVSDYIKVLPSTTYVHANFSMGGAYSVIYDINKNVISGFQTGTVTTPSNGYYIRMSGTVSNKAIQQFEIGSTSTTYEAYKAYINAMPFNLTDYVKTTDLPSVIPSYVTNKADLVAGTNLFNKDSPNIINGQYLGSIGDLNLNASYFVSDYIPVLPSTTYVHVNFDMGGARSCIYNANKTFVSQFQTGTITTPSTGYYIRMSGVVAKKAIQQFQLGTVSTIYEAYTYTVPATQLKLTQSLVNPFITNKLDKVVGKNLFNSSDVDILVGYYISDNGSFNANPYGINVSGWIPISSGQSLKANFGVGNTYVALYDSGKNYVAGSAVNTNVITWQTNAAYARFSYYTPVNNYQIEVGTVSTTYEAYTIYGFLGNQALQVPDRETICILPKKMFFIKNKQNSIYFENVLFKNLQDPTTIYFNKGTNYNRQVTFNFTAAATSQTFTTQIVRSFKKGEFKTITYDVIDPVTNNGKTINAIHVGDSFTDIGTWVKECKTLMNAQGVTYNLVGTNGDSTFRAEGLSGGNLENTFLNSSAGVGRRVQITGVTTLPSTTYPGRTYRDSTGVDWTIRSGKIDGSGNGYMVVLRYGAVNGDFATFPSSGTLTKQGSGEGDAVINYTNPTFCYFNPFINPSTGNLDITNYITTWGFATPNLIIFQFTWNDTSLWSSDTNLNSLVASFKTAADHVRAAYPSIKVIFSIEPYGSINGNLEWNGKKYTVLRFVELLLVQFEDNSSYNTWVKIAPAYAFVDLVYGYSGSTVTPNDRYPSVTEQSGGDGVHPNTGMLQIADCVAPIISAVI